MSAIAGSDGKKQEWSLALLTPVSPFQVRIPDVELEASTRTQRHSIYVAAEDLVYGEMAHSIWITSTEID